MLDDAYAPWVDKYHGNLNPKRARPHLLTSLTPRTHTPDDHLDPAPTPCHVTDHLFRFPTDDKSRREHLVSVLMIQGLQLKAKISPYPSTLNPEP